MAIHKGWNRMWQQTSTSHLVVVEDFVFIMVHSGLPGLQKLKHTICQETVLKKTKFSKRSNIVKNCRKICQTNIYKLLKF
jgi:hypothetical protein